MTYTGGGGVLVGNIPTASWSDLNCGGPMNGFHPSSEPARAGVCTLKMIYTGGGGVLAGMPRHLLWLLLRRANE